ncbi:hypothetical protein IWQ48_005821 [Labrenzia sp. EL_13]|nr:hypothetical protein [Labrenzia sp. EL_13]
MSSFGLPMRLGTTGITSDTLIARAKNDAEMSTTEQRQGLRKLTRWEPHQTNREILDVDRA